MEQQDLLWYQPLIEQNQCYLLIHHLQIFLIFFLVIIKTFFRSMINYYLEIQ